MNPLSEPSHPASQETLPRVYGRYVLLRLLARGGMGEIFLAKSGELSGFEKVCVIKRVLPKLIADKAFIKRFVDEAKVVINLNHANVASVFEVGQVDGDYFLALEYVHGRDLRRLLGILHRTRQRVPPQMALLVLREVATGLAYAHRQTDEQGTPLHLVHCDVSPPNVIISFEGEVKLIDFGVAKSGLRGQETNPRFGFGKFGYMAPEQLVRGGEVDKRTDVYAMGVLLFELLTGQRLFQFANNADSRAMAKMVALGKHALPSDKDPNLAPFDVLVKRALAVRKEKRFSSAEAFRDGVQAALAKLDPTLTIDKLGGWLKSIFQDELSKEQNMLAQLNSLRLDDYRSELTDAQTKVVSLAVHPGHSEATDPIENDEEQTEKQEKISRDEAAEPKASLSSTDSDAETAHTARTEIPRMITSNTALIGRNVQPPVRRRWLFVALLAAGGSAFGVLNIWGPSNDEGRPRSSGMVVTPTPVIDAPPPDATPLFSPDAREASAVEARSSELPRKEKKRPASKAAQIKKVRTRFRKLARDYESFKERHGAVLAPEWNDLAERVAFDPNADAQETLQQIRELRRKMNQFDRRLK